MAQTYTQIKNQLQLLIDRTDATAQLAADGSTVDVLDDFLRKAEQRFYRSHAARIPPLERFISYSLLPGTGVEALAIPNDYFEVRYLTASDGNSRQVTLARTSPEQILNTNLSVVNNIPNEFAYGNNEWLIRSPNQGTTVVANYYGYLDPISTVTDPTVRHWILNEADDLLVYWAAVDAALYYGGIDPTMMQSWEARAQVIHDQIVEQEIRQQSSGSTPRINRPYRSQRPSRFGYYF